MPLLHDGSDESLGSEMLQGVAIRAKGLKIHGCVVATVSISMVNHDDLGMLRVTTPRTDSKKAPGGKPRPRGCGRSGACRLGTKQRGRTFSGAALLCLARRSPENCPTLEARNLYRPHLLHRLVVALPRAILRAGFPPNRHKKRFPTDETVFRSADVYLAHTIETPAGAILEGRLTIKRNRNGLSAASASHHPGGTIASHP